MIMTKKANTRRQAAVDVALPGYRRTVGLEQ